jgi:hypothetical protein
MDRLPTHDDANLILRLYELRREDKMRQARSWFVTNFFAKTMAEFNELCPPGSEPNAYARMVTSYWNMAASFMTNGVLNEDLFFQSGQELLLTWIRVKPLVAEMRTTTGYSNAWKNLEDVGERFIQHLNATAPGFFEAFAARMGTRPPGR